MSQEDRQLEELMNQPLVTNTQPRGSMWTDIGDAKITHTLFGKARVRIIRRRDQIRRALLLALLAALAIAALVWQGWLYTRPNEEPQDQGVEPVASAVAPASAPVIPPASAPVPVVAQQTEPPQLLVKASAPVAAKPAVPLPAAKPQAVVIRPAAPAVVIPPVAQSAASSPVAVTPSAREVPPLQIPAGDQQLAEPISPQRE